MSGLSLRVRRIEGQRLVERDDRSSKILGRHQRACGDEIRRESLGELIRAERRGRRGRRGRRSLRRRARMRGQLAARAGCRAGAAERAAALAARLGRLVFGRASTELRFRQSDRRGDQGRGADRTEDEELRAGAARSAGALGRAVAPEGSGVDAAGRIGFDASGTAGAAPASLRLRARRPRRWAPHRLGRCRADPRRRTRGARRPCSR